MTNYEVVWDGTARTARYLSVESHPTRHPVPVASTLSQRPIFDTTKVNMGRRKMPACSSLGCSKRVDAIEDDFCRICRRD